MPSRDFALTSYRPLLSLILLTNLLCAAFSVAAQTRRTAPGARQPVSQPKQAAQKCSGAWTGVVTYTRTQSNSENKTVERVSGRGQDARDWQMKYDYTAQVAVVEAPEKNGSSLGKARINHSFSSIEKITERQRRRCDRIPPGVCQSR